MRHRLILVWYLIQLTSEAFVTTNARQEEFLALDSQHNALCNIDIASTAYAKIVDFLTGVLEDTRLRIVRGSPECKSKTKRPIGNDDRQTNLRLRWTIGQMMKAWSVRCREAKVRFPIVVLIAVNLDPRRSRPER